MTVCAHVHILGRLDGKSLTSQWPSHTDPDVDMVSSGWKGAAVRGGSLEGCRCLVRLRSGQELNGRYLILWY